MQSPLVAVFLAVIALSAVLQAGFVAALAMVLRLGNRKLDEMEAQFEADLVPQIRHAARLTDRAVALSEASLAHAQRVDGLVTEATRRAARYLDHATVRFGAYAERTAVRVETRLSARAERIRAHPLLQKLSGVASLVRGVQRALEVWQAAGAEPEVDDDYEEDDVSNPDADPDPSPA